MEKAKKEAKYQSLAELQEGFEQLRSLVNNEMTERMYKFIEKGNKTAGKDVRQYCSELKTLAQDIRVSIQDLKNKGLEN